MLQPTLHIALSLLQLDSQIRFLRNFAKSENHMAVHRHIMFRFCTCCDQFKLLFKTDVKFLYLTFVGLFQCAAKCFNLSFWKHEFLPAPDIFC